MQLVKNRGRLPLQTIRGKHGVTEYYNKTELNNKTTVEAIFGVTSFGKMSDPYYKGDCFIRMDENMLGWVKRRPVYSLLSSIIFVADVVIVYNSEGEVEKYDVGLYTPTGVAEDSVLFSRLVGVESQSFVGMTKIGSDTGINKTLYNTYIEMITSIDVSLYLDRIGFIRSRLVE